MTYGDSADMLLVPARYGATGTLLAVVPARAPGVRRTTHPTMSGDRLTDIEFEAVPLDGEPVLAGVRGGGQWRRISWGRSPSRRAGRA